MELSSYLIYLSISVVASASLGPSVILAANNGVNFGRRKAFFGVLGHVSAVLLLAIISASGVGALILASPMAFMVVKYIGVCYLIYIGYAIWNSKGKWALAAGSQTNARKRELYRQSFLLGLSNPKALVFFTSLFPQFIQPEQALLPQFLLLTGTSLINAFCFTFAYAWLAYKCKHRLAGLVNNGWFGKGVGSLFIFFASALALGR